LVLVVSGILRRGLYYANRKKLNPDRQTQALLAVARERDAISMILIEKRMQTAVALRSARALHS
jgi:hypothetical protein